MRRRIDSIQVIRAVAFIFIFLSHTEVLASGTVGVSLFLVLSGFCMMYSYYDRWGVAEKACVKVNFKFAVSKLKRLYPLHVCTLLAVAAAMGFILLRKGFPAKETAEQAFYFVMNAGLLQSWLPFRDGYFSFNAVSWYLSVVLFCYFMFPWILKSIKKDSAVKNMGKTALVIVLMTVIVVTLGVGRSLFNWSGDLVKWIVYICPLYRLGDFFVGAFFGFYFLRAPKPGNGLLYTVMEIIAVFVLIVQLVIYNTLQLPTVITYSLFWLPTSAAIVFLFSFELGGISTLLAKSKLLLWIGNISGDAFLIHQLAIKAVEYFVPNKLALTLLSFLVTVVCTAIYKKIEPKLLQLLHPAK